MSQDYPGRERCFSLPIIEDFWASLDVVNDRSAFVSC